MKYANLKHNGLAYEKENRIINLGDAFEIISIDQIYKRMGIPKEDIVYIDIYQLDTYDGEEVILPLNFMLFPKMMGKDMLKISPKITPVFLGISFAQAELDNTQIDFLKRWQPIGCRDERTRNILQEKGIDAYLAGCLATTIEYDNVCQGSKSKIAFIDVPQFVEKYIPNSIRPNIEFLQHEMFVSYEEIIDDQSGLNRALERIKYYSDEIRMIVTSRFHGAVIGLALGIPVILVAENNFYKFSWLSKILPFYDITTVDKIDWEPSKLNIDELKSKMIQVAINRIQNAVTLKTVAHDIDCMLSNANRSDDNALIYVSSAFEYIRNNWNKNEHIKYAIWGINQNAIELLHFIKKNYEKARLVAVYDGLRKTEFAGFNSQRPNSTNIQRDVFVFVTSNTANKTAEELFKAMDKKNYYLCTLDFIKYIGER